MRVRRCLVLPWFWIKHRHRQWQLRQNEIDPASWSQVLARFAFLPDHPRLKELASLLLARKEFSVVQPLQLSDDKAIAVVAQAALVILGISLRDELIDPLRRFDAIELFDGFVGIVLHPSEMLARRSGIDEAGVSHHWREALSGEVIEGGPLTLSWQDVSDANASSERGYNVVIHEFAHVIDMRAGHADGVPALPSQAAHRHWQAVFASALEKHQDMLNWSERFGAAKPWLDAYGASDPAEFFAVATEAYFVNAPKFQAEWPQLAALFDTFYEAWRWRSAQQ